MLRTEGLSQPCPGSGCAHCAGRENGYRQSKFFHKKPQALAEWHNPKLKQVHCALDVTFKPQSRHFGRGSALANASADHAERQSPDDRHHGVGSRVRAPPHQRAHQGTLCSRKARGKKLGGKRSNALSASCTAQGVAALEAARQRARSVIRSYQPVALQKRPCLAKTPASRRDQPPHSFENKSGFIFRR